MLLPPPRKYLCAIVLIAFSSFSHAGNDTAKERLAAFERTEAEIFQSGGTTLDRARSLSVAYDRLFSDDLRNHTEASSPTELEARFRAVTNVFFYTLDHKYLVPMKRILDEMISKNQAQWWHYYKMYSSLLAVRDFAGARSVLRKHPNKHIEPLPEIQDLTKKLHGATEWVIDSTNRRITRLDYEMPLDPVVIMIFNPNCHFSMNALRDIKNSGFLFNRLKTRLKILSPPDPNFSFDDFQTWNKQNPLFSTSLVHNRQEWPMIQDWGMPIFYFFRDRKLVTTVVGWPRAGNIDAVNNALDAIGVAADSRVGSN
jgi:hypothetical protein